MFITSINGTRLNTITDDCFRIYLSMIIVQEKWNYYRFDNNNNSYENNKIKIWYLNDMM